MSGHEHLFKGLRYRPNSRKSHEFKVESFLGDHLQNGSPDPIGPMSVLSCLSVTLVFL